MKIAIHIYIYRYTACVKEDMVDHKSWKEHHLFVQAPCESQFDGTEKYCHFQHMGLFCLPHSVKNAAIWEFSELCNDSNGIVFYLFSFSFLLFFGSQVGSIHCEFPKMLFCHK